MRIPKVTLQVTGRTQISRLSEKSCRTAFSCIQVAPATWQVSARPLPPDVGLAKDKASAWGVEACALFTHGLIPLYMLSKRKCLNCAPLSALGGGRWFLSVPLLPVLLIV